jgi:hypothetical protein
VGWRVYTAASQRSSGRQCRWLNAPSNHNGCQNDVNSAAIRRVYDDFSLQGLRAVLCVLWCCRPNAMRLIDYNVAGTKRLCTRMRSSDARTKIVYMMLTQR